MKGGLVLNDKVSGFFTPLVPTVVDVDLYKVARRHPHDVTLYLTNHVRITAVLPDRLCIEHLGIEKNPYNSHAMVPPKHVINGTCQLQIDLGCYRLNNRSPGEPIRFGSPLDGCLLPEILFDPDPLRSFAKVGDEGSNEIYSKSAPKGDLPIEIKATVDSHTGLLVALSKFTPYPREMKEVYRLAFSNWVVPAEVSDDVFRTDVPVGLVSSDAFEDMVVRTRCHGAKDALRSASVPQLLRELISRAVRFRRN